MSLSPSQVAQIVESRIQAFGTNQRDAINKLQLTKLLQRKNPYLFMARRADEPDDFAEELVAAALSASDRR